MKSLSWGNSMLELKDLTERYMQRSPWYRFVIEWQYHQRRCSLYFKQNFHSLSCNTEKKNCLGESKQMEPTTPTKQYFLDRNLAGPEKKTRLEYMYYFCHRGREIIREILTERWLVDYIRLEKNRAFQCQRETYKELWRYWSSWHIKMDARPAISDKEQIKGQKRSLMNLTRHGTTMLLLVKCFA